MVIRETCPARGSPRHKKNGHTRHGEQHHQGKVWRRQFTANAIDQSIAHEQRRQIEQLLCKRLSLRGICRTVGGSLTWFLHFLVECYTACPDHLHAQLPARLAEVLRMWMPVDGGFQLWQPHLRNIGQLDLRGNVGYGAPTLARLWIDK
jgi:hypothetical protein